MWNVIVTVASPLYLAPYIGVAERALQLAREAAAQVTIHPQTGAVLNAEHGPNGGDEVNVIRPGRNYGWPRFSYGRNYDGSVLSENSSVSP